MTLERLETMVALLFAFITAWFLTVHIELHEIKKLLKKLRERGGPGNEHN